jgi:holo-[acyl-carrier protein] synthase
VAGQRSPHRDDGQNRRLSVMLDMPTFSPPNGNVVAVGIDLAEVSEVRRSIDHFGAQYLDRIFTSGEQAQCAASFDPTPHFAARFAAKEATIKALAADDPIPPWTSMEVQRQPAGGCTLRLTGRAARIALEKGIDGVLVSLSHEGDMAIAVVVAISNSEHVELDLHGGDQHLLA